MTEDLLNRTQNAKVSDTTGADSAMQLKQKTKKPKT